MFSDVGERKIKLAASRRLGCACGVIALSVLGQAGLAAIDVVVVASPDPARPGETLDLEITVTNNGGNDRSGVQVVLDYPPGMAYLDDSLYAGNCPSNGCEPGEQAVFEIATLAAGKGMVFSLPALVNGGAADGTIIPFDVNVFDDSVLEAEATTSVIVDGGRELELALVEDRDPIAPGGLLTYSLMYGVRETSGGSAGAVLSLPLPPGTSLVSATGGGALAAGVVQWQLGNLNPSAVGERRVTLQIDSGAAIGSMITAQAVFDDQFGNMVAYAAATRVQNEIPLELVVTASPNPIRPAETIDFEMTVTNTGAFDKSGVILRLEYPDHAAYIDDSLYDGNCPSNGCESREPAVFDIGTLAAGKGRTFSMPILIHGDTINGIVTTFEAVLSDSSGDSRESGASIAVTDDRILELALVENRDPATAGGPDSLVTYTLTFGALEFSGGSIGTTLRLALPDNASFVSASGGGAVSGGEVIWNLDALNPGDSGERRVTVAVNEDTKLGAIIRAEASLDNAFGDLVDYQAATRVAEEIPLQLTIAASPDPVRPAEVMDLELTVTNTGVFDRTGVTLRLEYPDHAAYLDDTLYDGNCPSNGCEPRERATFNIGTLPAGEGRTFFLPVRIGGSVQNGVVTAFEAEMFDGTGDRRESEESIAVSAGRTLDLALVESDDPVVANSDITYTLTYGASAGGNGAADAILRLHLPPDVTLLSASDGGELVDDAVEWEVGALNPGAGGERFAVVQPDADLPLGAILPLAADFDFGGQDGSINEVRFQEATRMQLPVPLDVEITAQPNPAPAGATLDVVVSVFNTTSLTRTGVVLKMEYPEHLGYLDDSLYDGNCPSNGCEPLETATFDVGPIAAGQEISFLVPAPVHGATAAGAVINFDARVTDSTGFHGDAGDALMVGTEFDDAGGLLGDINADCLVDSEDLNLVLAGFGPLYNSEDLNQVLATFGSVCQ